MAKKQVFKYVSFMAILLMAGITHQSAQAFEYEFGYGVSGWGEISYDNEFDYWGFEGSAGDEIEINMYSYGELDPYLVLWYFDGSDWAFIDENDNNDSDRNKWDATIWATLPDDGYYSIVASSSGYANETNGTYGEYEIILELLNSNFYLDAPAGDESDTGFQNCGITGCDDFGDPGEYCEVLVVDDSGYVGGTASSPNLDFWANQGDDISITVTTTSGDLISELWVWRSHSTGAEAVFIERDQNDDGFILLQDVIRISGNYSVGVSPYRYGTAGNYNVSVSLGSVDYCSGSSDSGTQHNAEYDDEIIVAVIDSGVNENSELKNVLIAGWDPMERTNDVTDYVPHGTYRAEEVHNEAPNAYIMPVKMYGSGSWGYLDDGIEWAVNSGADVINMSIHDSYRDSYCIAQDEIYDAVENDVLVVAAVGNANSSERGYSTHGHEVKFPAGCDGVIGVGAISGSGDVYSLDNESVDMYVVAGSTSEAAARLSGLVAALLGKYPYDSDGIYNTLWCSVYYPNRVTTQNPDIANPDRYNYPVVDFEKALRYGTDACNH